MFTLTQKSIGITKDLVVTDGNFHTASCCRPRWEVGPNTFYKQEEKQNLSILGSYKDKAIAIHCHAYHLDLVLDLLDAWQCISNRYVFFSTDTYEKAQSLDKLLKRKGEKNYSIKITKNTGRDIAPLLIDWKDEIRDFSILIHCHTKKSPHEPTAISWRNALISATFGNNYLNDKALEYLQYRNSGLVFPWPPQFMSPIMNWGKNYYICKQIMAMLGLKIKQNDLLYFPAGSFFWAKTDALIPLMDLGLNHKHFETEPISLDGTLSHALERCIALLPMLEKRTSYATWIGHDFNGYQNGPKQACIAQLPENMNINDNVSLINYYEI